MRTRRYTVIPTDVVQNVNTLAREIESIADEICCAVKKKCGIQPRSERKGSHVFVIWPDGEVSNDIEIFLD